MGLPPFHTLGILGYTIITIYHAMSTGVYPLTVSGSPMLPIPQIILENAKRTKCTGMITIPAVLHVWAQSESDVEDLAKFEHVVRWQQLKTTRITNYMLDISGGPVSPKVGDDLVAAGVNLQCAYGATEFGPCTRFFPRRGREQDWEWVDFHESAPFEWIDQGDGSYEAHRMVYPTPALLRSYIR